MQNLSPNCRKSQIKFTDLPLMAHRPQIMGNESLILEQPWGKDEADSLKNQNQAAKCSKPRSQFRLVVVGDADCDTMELVQALCKIPPVPESIRALQLPMLSTFETTHNDIRFTVLDVPTEQRFDGMRPQIYRSADGVVCCFDLASESSFQNFLDKWLPEVHAHCNVASAKLMVALNCKHLQRRIGFAKIYSTALANGFKYYEHDQTWDATTILDNFCPLVKPEVSDADSYPEVTSSCFAVRSSSDSESASRGRSITERHEQQQPNTSEHQNEDQNTDPLLTFAYSTIAARIAFSTESSSSKINTPSSLSSRHDRIAAKRHIHRCTIM